LGQKSGTLIAFYRQKRILLITSLKLFWCFQTSVFSRNFINR